MSGLLHGKCILVTGAARCIGLAMTDAIAADGGAVAMADIDGTEVQGQIRRIGPASGEMDVSDGAAVRSGTPHDCAGAFLFLLSGLSNYITGQCIAVDGGLTATY